MRFEFFTINPPSLGKETNTDGTLTSYAINNFLNAENIQPTDVSCEFNENTNTLLVSIGYKESKSVLQDAIDFLKKHNGYRIRFNKLAQYDEKSHTKYLQLELENSVNFDEHENISHGIYVENGMAYCAFLEYKNKEENAEFQMKQILIFLALVLVSLSCDKEAKEKVETDNKEFNVELLFEIDGCKVYRFVDGGHNRYFTNCNGSVQWHESCGKNCTRAVEVPTSK